ncbi:MAG: hypothetical protein LBG15_13785 [Dysgonamonadaceae bacterium]|jgi:hypothetical protein|nr:hypothetical protein [Dysgonamonadaceae bacterium]
MYHKSTQKNSEEWDCSLGDEKIVFNILNPQKKTLTFIMQFACAYHVENRLPLEMSEMILN